MTRNKVVVHHEGTCPLPSSWLDRLSSRAALGVADASATTVGTAPLPRAQLATPASDPREVTLFVRTAHGGTVPHKPGGPDVYGLTLQGAAARTGCPFDRPDRIVGDVSTEAFLNLFGFTPFDPPSAATVVQTATGEDILVLGLFDAP